ncbi:hypothetical protein TFKS16_0262 [Tannerella forsythia KS16]|uniref:DUF1016 domain-containing protein n=2 Tax=Tannerella forsythia TaxID=28112 RepID=A0A1D3UDD0_TANFO|nr:hypothetical protein TFKS16_0262 [Tannerella forsythia KS16]SCQ18120.1 hypothetical protein TFUB20_00241 [Tannerella forsythia]
MCYILLYHVAKLPSLHKRQYPTCGSFYRRETKNAPESGKSEKSFSVTDEKQYLCNKIIGYGRQIAIMIDNKHILHYSKSIDLLSDARQIIDEARTVAYSAINLTLVQRNWLLGKRISEESLKGEDRAKYGAEIIKKLAKQLTAEYGNGFTKTNLYSFMDFYRAFPDIFHTHVENSLHWSHYRTLLQVTDPVAREWYMNEAIRETWSVRTLQRNISSQYYHRLLQSQHKELVEKEMLQITAPLQKTDKLEFVKNPVVAEFLGLASLPDFTETELETAIINNLQKFLMELGKGFAFVARQQHIHTGKDDYYIDLVFYNYILKCFCLFDLKTTKVSHQDIGQMDMYVRMYDELKRNEGDNPTMGIILCADTDEDIARYSILHGNEQLFASKYKLYLPSEEELRAEIETQKQLFYLQQEERKKFSGIK